MAASVATRVAAEMAASVVTKAAFHWTWFAIGSELEHRTGRQMDTNMASNHSNQDTNMASNMVASCSSPASELVASLVAYLDTNLVAYLAAN